MKEHASSAESVTMLANLSELRESKGVVSRKIGQAKKSGQPIDNLLAEMQAISRQIKLLEETEKKTKSSATIKEETLPPQAPARFISAEHHSQTAPADNAFTIVSVQSNSDINKWNSFISTNNHSSAYHQYCLRDVIENTFGHKTNYLLAINNNDQAVGALPLVQLNSFLFGNYVVSMPFFNYGGALAESRHIEEQLFNAAKQWADSIGAKHTELRHVQPKALAAVKQDKVTMMLALPESANILWQNIGSKVRAQINKTEEHKPSYRIGRLDLLDDFYRVFSTNMRDLGTPVYSKKWFANLLNALTDTSFIVVAYIESKPVAAAFLIGWKDTLEIPWASSLREFNYSNINMFLYWQVLNEAINRGYSFFDFGRSSKDANTYRFKKQWGAQPQQLYWHYQLADGASLPELNPHNPKYKLMITVWQKLPLLVANLIGPHVVKSLP